MYETLLSYWPHLLALASFALAAGAAVHAAMTKDEVRSAIGWVALILLSPVIGALIYLAAGINRIRRTSLAAGRQAHGLPLPAPSAGEVPQEAVATRFGRRFAALRVLGDRVTGRELRGGNRIEPLTSGDAAYGAMCAAIASAERSVLLETYIFDNDPAGLRFAGALVAAARRGVEVRVLVDAVGARYSRPSIARHLRAEGVNVALFNGHTLMAPWLPYANLRTHRKILLVDGTTAFTGGMNIRQAFAEEFMGEDFSRDTHFRLEGPVVADIFSVAAEDWYFATDELLSGPAWDTPPAAAEPAAPVLLRVVASGPDASIETNQKLLMGAFSIARFSIRIMSPYFLPDRELQSALNTAARRGVEIDIVVPEANNLKLVDRAMQAQFDQVLRNGCRVWRAGGSFDHSKLLCVDATWAFVGSSNLDPRSLRLNFEMDIEVLDHDFAAAIDARILAARGRSRQVMREDLRNRPFAVRLLDRAFWLGSPYL